MGQQFCLAPHHVDVGAIFRYRIIECTLTKAGAYVDYGPCFVQVKGALGLEEVGAEASSPTVTPTPHVTRREFEDLKVEAEVSKDLFDALPAALAASALDHATVAPPPPPAPPPPAAAPATPDIAPVTRGGNLSSATAQLGVLQESNIIGKRQWKKKALMSAYLQLYKK